MVIDLKLTPYDIHILLKELEHGMCFVNRDVQNAKYLWEKIATQMNGVETKMIIKEPEK